MGHLKIDDDTADASAWYGWIRLGNGEWTATVAAATLDWCWWLLLRAETGGVKVVDRLVMRKGRKP